MTVEDKGVRFSRLLNFCDFLTPGGGGVRSRLVYSRIFAGFVIRARAVEVRMVWFCSENLRVMLSGKGKVSI